MNKKSLKALAMNSSEIIVNQVVMCDGSGMWGTERGTKVRVSKIIIQRNFDIDNPTYLAVWVFHNKTSEIYTDDGFEMGISDILSKVVGVPVKVNFTEQGMQRDGTASMETSDTGSVRALLKYIGQ
jgi:hypothetical protein